MASDDQLASVRGELRAFVDERDWRKFHDPKNLAMLIASEAGELMSILRWVRNEDADAFMNEPANHERIAAELADVAIGVLLFCDRANLDPVEIVRRKIARNRANYPAETVRGKAERPDRPDR